MKTMIRVLTATAGLAAFLHAAGASADDTTVYSNSFRLGLYSVFYHTSANDLAGPYVPEGVNFKARDLETLYVGMVRRLSADFDLELALGYPPLSKVEGKGPATLGSVPYNGVVVSSARWLSPTLLLEYKFLSDNSKFRPYIGAGVNYTAFYDRNQTSAGDAASGGPTKLSLSSSVGPAGTVGAGYAFTSRWHMYASYSISRVKTHVQADTAGVIRTTDISFGPQALVVSGGYSF
jgi:outer membrane protein